MLALVAKCCRDAGVRALRLSPPLPPPPPLVSLRPFAKRAGGPDKPAKESPSPAYKPEPMLSQVLLGVARLGGERPASLLCPRSSSPDPIGPQTCGCVFLFIGTGQGI